MSVVDTWSWNSIKPMEEEFEMDTNMKVHCALYEFERTNGIRPNRIVMGYDLMEKVVNQFYYMNIPMKTLEEVVKEQKLGMYCTYEGIPVKVDYDNPDILEVGYMMKY